MNRIVIMIIDSNPFSRSGLRKTLSEQESLGILEILEWDPTQETLEGMTHIAESAPDVVLLDIDFPSLSGLDLGRKITRHARGTRVVMLSDNPYENDDELFEVIKTGAVAYLRSRNCTTEELIDTIGRASKGKYPINDCVSSRPQVAQRLLRQFQDMASMGKPLEDVTAPLTGREVQILTLIAEGNSNKRIADILGISEQTIKNQVSAILRKINANDRAHAVFIALREGLISFQQGRESGQRDNNSQRSESAQEAA
jgi:DNA-binding NarL/FixJ family response regulator